MLNFIFAHPLMWYNHLTFLLFIRVLGLQSGTVDNFLFR
nr:MAG TPA: hypothetical protein [Caudoviricetes sp.]